MEKTIVVVSGYWSTNIGNAFFQLGAQHMLQSAFPHAQVILVADQPGYYNVRRGNPKNALIPLEYMPIDYLAILGPFLRPEYTKIWQTTIEKLSARGVKVLLLSAGMMAYETGLVERSRGWLAKVKPYILTTRDEETYQNFADLAEYAYNGIDAAFFVSDFYDPVPLDFQAQEYVVFNFDKIPEPYFHVGTPVGHAPDHTFEFRDETWSASLPSFKTKLSRSSRAFSFIEPLLGRTHPYPEEIEGLKVIRTDHRFNPLLMQKAYKGPNSFASDIPWPYLDIYSQASCVFSNRVHACVAALAYGKPAMLFYKTPRARLLQRMGADEITQRPCTIPGNRLAEEKQALLEFLQRITL